MIAGAMMIVIVVGGALLLDWLLPDRAKDRLVHIFRFDEENRK